MRVASRICYVLGLALFFGIGSNASAVRADALYQVTNLGSNLVYGLSASGQVLEAYYASNQSPIGTPLLYSSYGPNAGQQNPIPLQSAMAMSANGTVSGYGPIPGSPLSQAEIYNVNTPNTPPTSVQTNFPALTGTLANNLYTSGVNDSGQAVGTANTLSPSYVPGGPALYGPQHAFLSEGATITDLGTLGGPSSAATAINNAGRSSVTPLLPTASRMHSCTLPAR